MYLKTVEFCSDIYQFPYRIFGKFKNVIMDYKKQNGSRAIIFRLQNKSLKKSNVFLKIQIINRRATYQVSLSSVINDYTFIKHCDPKSLIEIGYFSKVEEFKRLLHFDKNQKKKLFSFHFHQKPKENNLNLSNYGYIFLDIQKCNFQRNLRLLVKESNKIFSLPFEDFLIDSCLLNNIYPPDLLRIGYQLCELDIREKCNPRFVF